MKTGKTRTYSIFLLLSFMLIVTAALSVQPGEFEARGESKIFEPAQTYIDHGAVEIDGDADFLTTAADEGWPGTGTAGDPIIIEGYKFYATLVQPVRIWRTDLHWIFRNNLITTDGVICGIWTDSTTHGWVVNNTLDNCHSGIVIANDENLIFEDNVIVGNTGNGVDIIAPLTNGIIRNNEIYDLGGDAIICEEVVDVEISGNYIHDMPYDGIEVSGGENSVIKDNVILDTRTAIRVGRSASDIEISNNTIQGVQNNGINCIADSTTIEHNTIRDVGLNGILLTDSMSAYADNNVISENVIINCTEYSIEIGEGCSGNSVTENDFFETQDDCHICDDGDSTTITGNFYDTWASPDVDEDSVVDNPYTILGTAENSDAAPVAAPINTLPSDYEYVPVEPTPTTTDGGSLPLMEIAVIGGIGLVVCVVIVALVKRR
ncbi:MAG: right-handed parallel beta-helix repeat-containing protein [Candidatus Thorarchaeota archaeon]